MNTYWKDRAACLGMDQTLFYGPEYPEDVKTTIARVRAAKLVCQGCPVRRECLAEAQRHRDAYGVWGGLTDKQRRKLRARSAA